MSPYCVEIIPLEIFETFATLTRFYEVKCKFHKTYILLNRNREKSFRQKKRYVNILLLLTPSTKIVEDRLKMLTRRDRLFICVFSMAGFCETKKSQVKVIKNIQNIKSN